MNAEHKVKSTAEQFKMWQQQDTIVIAVSGGIDSMVLLHMMKQFAQLEQLQLVVAHVNHGFRAEESEQERLLVEQTARELDIPFAYIALNMPNYLRTHIGNAQELARKRRYQFLHEVAAQYGANTIATAHHADDQVETVLQHLLRGTGMAGLSGMAAIRAEKNVQLIRPFIRITKDEIIAYQSAHGIAFLEDSSNKKVEYSRNQIRLELIPYLEQYNPNFKDAMLRLSELTSDEHDYMEDAAKTTFKALVEKEGQSFKFKRHAFIVLHVALQRRVIKLILNYLSDDLRQLSYDSIERVKEALSSATTTAKINVSDHIWCILEYDEVRFIRDLDIAAYIADSQQVMIPYESTQLSFGNWVVNIEITDQQQPITSRFTAIFDANALRFPLVIRTKQAGDRMQVQGISGTKKVQDLFVDSKVPSIHRTQYPIICDQEQIIWVPGIRRSGYALVRAETKSYVIIEVYKHTN